MTSRRADAPVSPDVLVVGAGPTGLTAALQAHAHGATVRVVERRDDPFRPSRAMIMHSRTLESLRPLGVTDAILERADTAPRAELHLGHRRVHAKLARVDLPDTAFPHLTLVPQLQVETILARALEERGVAVERGTSLVDLEASDEGRVAVLEHQGTVEKVPCRFVAGCDGSQSAVRRRAGIDFAGGDHREEVVLADVDLEGGVTAGGLHVAVGRHGLVFLFALGEGAPWRLLATRPADGTSTSGREVSMAELRRLVGDSCLPATIADSRWSTSIRLQHRLAGAYRDGPVFLAGDAAHVHSPAAAQGMNTGVLDAVNLGWKLGFASRHTPANALLSSYEDERRPVARQVIALTRLVFFAEASTSPLAELARTVGVPLVAPAVPWLVGQPRLMAAVVRLLSQGWVNYRSSPLSVDDEGAQTGPRAGDRLPDRAVTSGGQVRRLHEVTAAPGVHLLLGRGAASPLPALLGPWVCVHRLDDVPGRGMVAVRPDGHVGYRSAHDDAARLGAWLDLVGAR
jgi:2-polyprenyl-6-methoxyphenol hydroxylase-like FAD-dependent oxidoreductase